MEDRRRKLQELKAKTKCQACGQIGHWAGDSSCPKQKAHANLATTTCSGEDSGIVLNMTEGDELPTSLMMVKKKKKEDQPPVTHGVLNISSDEEIPSTEDHHEASRQGVDVSFTRIHSGVPAPRRGEASGSSDGKIPILP